MKIAILTNTLYKGRGMDYVAEQQALELCKKGHDVAIYTFDYDHSIDNVPINKLNWPKGNLVNFIYRLLYPLDLHKNWVYSTKLKEYDVIVSHFFPITYISHLTKVRYSSVKVIYYDHGVSDNQGEPIIRKIYLKIISSLMLWTISNVDGIVSISKYCQDQLRNIDTKKWVVYNTIDIGKFDYTFSDIDANLCHVLNDNCPKFLYVGVMAPYKGIDYLVKSFKMVAQKYPNAKLYLVGSPSYGFDLSQYISECKNIVYLGRVSDPALGYLYHKCDVYVTASTWEGFNLPLVEAQLMGTPGVAFDVGAHGEVLDSDNTGLLVKPFSVDKFAEAMCYVYQNKVRMGNNAKLWAKRFSISRSTESLNDIVESLQEEGDDY